MKKLLLAGLVGALLVGCGGGSDGVTTVPPAPSTIAEQFASSLDWDIDEINTLCSSLVCEYNDAGFEVVKYSDTSYQFIIGQYVEYTTVFRDVPDTFFNAESRIVYENVYLFSQGTLIAPATVSNTWVPTYEQLVELSHTSEDVKFTNSYNYLMSSGHLNGKDRTEYLASDLANILGNIYLSKLNEEI